MNVGIVIPTLNRSEFLARQLEYYADLDCPHGIYIGDSSDPQGIEKTQRVVDRLGNKLKIRHIHCPDLNDSQTIGTILEAVEEPYSAFVADDDFLVPSTLTHCADFLDSNQEYSTADGVATMLTLSNPGPYGQSLQIGNYRRQSLTDESGSQRLQKFFGNYFVTVFSVHRTEDFRQEIKETFSEPDKGFRELLTSALPIIKGKAKSYELFYMARQDHSERYLEGDIWSWITQPEWSASCQNALDRLTTALVKQDGISHEEAGEVVKQAFWSYVAHQMQRQWNVRYGTRNVGRSRRLVGRIPPLQRAWRELHSRLPGENSRKTLKALLRPGSPYHNDFMPVYRAITTPPLSD